MIKTSENNWYNCPFWYEQTGQFEFTVYTSGELPDELHESIRGIKEAADEMVIKLPSN
jgi:hypothetical protein